MTDLMSQPHKPPVRPALRTRRQQRLLAVGLVLVGAMLLAGNIGVLPAGLSGVWKIAGPLCLVALGAWLIATQRTTENASVPNFAIDRADFERASLIAVAGQVDLEVRSFAGASQLAVGQFPSARGPGLSARGTEARIELSGRHATPLLPAQSWSASLAKGLPWSLDVRSSSGDMRLDLRDLTLTDLRLSTTLGNVSLAVPATGKTDIYARLVTGDLSLHVPESMAVKINVRQGPLAAVRPDTRRFVQLAPGEWASPLFAVSPNRCTLHVDLWAGDLDVE